MIKIKFSKKIYIISGAIFLLVLTFTNNPVSYWAFKTIGISNIKVNNESYQLSNNKIIENKIIDISKLTRPAPHPFLTLGGPLAWYKSNIILDEIFRPIFIPRYFNEDFIEDLSIQEIREIIINQGYKKLDNQKLKYVLEYKAELSEEIKLGRGKFEFYEKSIDNYDGPHTQYNTYVVIKSEIDTLTRKNVFGFITSHDCLTC